jgi:hypothetical protein
MVTAIRRRAIHDGVHALRRPSSFMKASIFNARPPAIALSDHRPGLIDHPTGHQ